MMPLLRRIALCFATGTPALLGLLWAAPAEAQRLLPLGQAPIRDSDHVFQRRVISYVALKRQNIVMQQRDFSCGAAALATVMRYYWQDDITEQHILESLDKLITERSEILERLQNGLSMTDLRRAAVDQGYLSTIGRLTFKELREAKIPLVVGIVVDGYDHFAVYRGADSYYVYLADPSRGNIRVPISEFLPQWQENAVLVVAKGDQDPPKTSPLSLRPSEISLGWTNGQVVRRELTRQHTAPPLPLP